MNGLYEWDSHNMHQKYNFWQLYRHGFMSNDSNIERFYELAMSGSPENRGCVFHAQGRQDFFMSGAGKFYE